MDQINLDTIYRWISEALEESQHCLKDPISDFKELPAFYKKATELMGQGELLSSYQKEHECRSGCASCCYQSIPVTPLEAIFIA
ncbi:MAG: hypothetical protein ACKOAD_05765, partial [Gammaproteobacteria bacterium]